MKAALNELASDIPTRQLPYSQHPRPSMFHHTALHLLDKVANGTEEDTRKLVEDLYVKLSADKVKWSTVGPACFHALVSVFQSIHFHRSSRALLTELALSGLDRSMIKEITGYSKRQLTNILHKHSNNVELNLWADGRPVEDDQEDTLQDLDDNWMELNACNE